MVRRRIFGPRRDEVTGGSRKPYDDEYNNLYCSPNIITMIKSRRMRWEGHVASMGRRESHTKLLLERLNGRDHSEHTGVDGRILNWILWKQGWWVWMGFIWLKTGISNGLLAWY
jgi:hypothetical protein